MKETKNLIRTCSSCGLEKPISAFLQISGSHGTIYGNICATCRSKEAREKPKLEGDEERGTIPTGQRIGAKEKAYADKKVYRQIQDNKELDRKDRQQKDLFKEEKIEKTLIKEKERQSHKKHYLETKTEFLIGKKSPPGQIPPAAKSQPGDNKIQQRFIEQKINRELANEAEIRKVATNFSSIHHPLQEGRAELHSPTFLRFKQLLGESAPIVKMMETLFKKASNEKPAAAKSTQTNAEKGEDLVNYTKNSWGPRKS